MKVLKNILWNWAALFFGAIFILPSIFIKLITLGEIDAVDMWTKMIDKILSNKKK